jgi:hypothetical protein
VGKPEEPYIRVVVETYYESGSGLHGDIQSSGTSVSASVGSISAKRPLGTSAGPGSVASPPAAQAGSTSMLDLSDPWLASALAVAIKAHIEAAPADAANIKARGFGLKTVEDLAQYYKDMTPIVQNARVQARQQKVAARKQLVSQTGAVEAAHQAVTAQVIGKLS